MIAMMKKTAAHLSLTLSLVFVSGDYDSASTSEHWGRRFRSTGSEIGRRGCGHPAHAINGG